MTEQRSGTPKPTPAPRLLWVVLNDEGAPVVVHWTKEGAEQLAGGAQRVYRVMPFIPCELFAKENEADAATATTLATPVGRNAAPAPSAFVHHERARTEKEEPQRASGDSKDNPQSTQTLTGEGTTPFLTGGVVPTLRASIDLANARAGFILASALHASGDVDAAEIVVALSRSVLRKLEGR